MKHSVWSLATPLCLLSASALADWPVPPVSVLRQQSLSRTARAQGLDVLTAHRRETYPAHNISIPIDHFHNSSAYEPHSHDHFDNLYYFDDRYYLPGGPVILLLGGEIGADTRLPFLEKGIAAKLAKATHGMAVILEHRFYGGSMPTANFSTESLRFLTTEQALEDTAYFAQNVVFPGHEDEDITANAVPYIVYGGSYAGAQAAFQRTLYPSVFWGAISSSGVTEALYEYSEYWEPIRENGPKKCIRTTEALTGAIDTILTEKKGLIAELKDVFGMASLSDNQDFANVLTFSGIGGWQARNWDPKVSGNGFRHYCDNLTSSELLYPELVGSAAAMADLLAAAGAMPGKSQNLTVAALNWIGYLRKKIVVPCLKAPGDEGRNKTLDDCYSTNNATFYAQDDREQTWRAWPYQYVFIHPPFPAPLLLIPLLPPSHPFLPPLISPILLPYSKLTTSNRYCTQWGYLQTGSNQPSHLPPLISRTLDLPYMSRICSAAFNITTPPDVYSINKWGGFNISAPRLAHIAGSADPWTPATPWREELRQWEWRSNSTSEPFLLIEGAVHHWDENGMNDSDGIGESDDITPPAVRATQDWEVEFVKAWVEEAKESGLFSGMKPKLEMEAGAAELEVETKEEEEVDVDVEGMLSQGQRQKVLGV